MKAYWGNAAFLFIGKYFFLEPLFLKDIFAEYLFLF
jgi:hypothetical protein